MDLQVFLLGFFAIGDKKEKVMKRGIRDGLIIKLLAEFYMEIGVFIFCLSQGTRRAQRVKQVKLERSVGGYFFQ